MKGHLSEIVGIGFTSCGNYLVSASGDSTIRFWDVATGDPAGELEGDPSEGSGPVKSSVWD
jgi:WD40 repeat protein